MKSNIFTLGFINEQKKNNLFYIQQTMVRKGDSFELTARPLSSTPLHPSPPSLFLRLSFFLFTFSIFSLFLFLGLWPRIVLPNHVIVLIYAHDLFVFYYSYIPEPKLEHRDLSCDDYNY